MNVGTYILGVIWLLIIWLVVGAWRLRHKRVMLGPAAVGAMNERFDDRRRAAIEVIIEERRANAIPKIAMAICPILRARSSSSSSGRTIRRQRSDRSNGDGWTRKRRSSRIRP